MWVRGGCLSPGVEICMATSEQCIHQNAAAPRICHMAITSSKDLSKAPLLGTCSLLAQGQYSHAMVLQLITEYVNGPHEQKIQVDITVDYYFIFRPQEDASINSCTNAPLRRQQSCCQNNRSSRSPNSNNFPSIEGQSGTCR